MFIIRLLFEVVRILLLFPEMRGACLFHRVTSLEQQASGPAGPQ